MPTPRPPPPKLRLPTPSTSPCVGVKHQDGEKLSSMEKRKLRSVKQAKAPDAKRFESPMAPIFVKSLGIRLMVLPKLMSLSTALPKSPSPILISPSQDPETTTIPSAMGAMKKRKRSSWTHKVILPTSISAVLDNDDLLGEVLLRLALPTSLVRATMVCRRWLCVSSTPSFLDRFYDLQPSHILGFYVHSSHLRIPKFVPMPGLPSELAASVRLAGSSLDAYTPATSKASILCCRYGHLLVRLDGPNGRSNAVFSPLRPERGMTILPPPPSAFFDDNVTWLGNSENPYGGVTACAAWKHAGE
ncbi:hypothetical protein EJB05_27518 [Eragrostis curvula]|uniref:F-box domain-containing protein n=1 Tax=Eragrostis curvula TaxID=38414 RepID=A0A5J9UMR7_9POAL|nr:hypothetical protein EJB05_27518 [Eragrostis curvula]